jgi:hypothetical protein
MWIKPSDNSSRKSIDESNHSSNIVGRKIGEDFRIRNNNSTMKRPKNLLCEYHDSRKMEMATYEIHNDQENKNVRAMIGDEDEESIVYAI